MTVDGFERARAFRELHEQPGIFVVPNPWDTGTARILEALGFPALATTSAGFAFSMGLRDGDGAVTASKSIDHARKIVNATSLPVTADLENGFGDSPEVVANTIRLAGEVGLAGASIEDATYDAEAPLYERTLAAERVAAAVEAARSLPYPFTLTARTEGFIRGRPDMDETLRRLETYAAAGADVLYAPGLPDLTSIREVCALGKPVNYVAGLSGPQFSLHELREAGVRRVSTGSSLARAALSGLLSAAREITDSGTFTFARGAMTVGDWNEYFRAPPDV